MAARARKKNGDAHLACMLKDAIELANRDLLSMQYHLSRDKRGSAARCCCAAKQILDDVKGQLDDGALENTKHNKELLYDEIARLHKLIWRGAQECAVRTHGTGYYTDSLLKSFVVTTDE